jgi:RecA-family ATPase
MLFHSAVQFRDAGISQAAAEVDLLKTAHVTGLTDAEARHTIASAYRGPRREPIGGGVPRPRNPGPIRATSTVRKAQKNIDPKQLPDPIEEGLKQLIQTCFRPGENIAIGDHNENQGRHTPSGGCTFDYDELLQQLDERGHINRIFGDEEGLYIRVNPLRPSGGRDDDVTAWRHVLVEFDRDQNNSPIPKEKQYAAILDSGLPVSAIIDSGNKSVHAWVRVDAENKDQFKERVEKVWAHFEGMHLDSANRNASRYSRCPDAVRTLRDGDYKVIDTVRQQLLQVGVGAKSWEEWKVENEDGGLPPIPNGLAFMLTKFPSQKVLLEGMLSMGERMCIGAPPKANKTYILLDLALAVASGREWIGVKCNQGKVLYVDFEFKPRKLQERLDILSSHLFSAEEAEAIFQYNFDPWTLKGHATDISTMVDQAIRRARNRNYDLIVIDPIYKCLGHRKENDSSDMNDFFNHVERLQQATDAAVIYAHHFRKLGGDWRRTNPTELLAGSGVVSRDADAILVLAPAPIKGNPVKRYMVHTELRHFAPIEPFAVRQEYPVLVRDDAIYAKESRGPKSGKKNILDFLAPDGMTAKQWQIVAEEKNVSSSTFYHQLGKLRESGDVSQNSAGIYTRT